MRHAGWGLGRLALWLELRGDAATPDGPALEKPKGKTVLVHTSADAQIASEQVQRRLKRLRPDVNLLQIGPQNLSDPSRNLAAATAMITTLAPSALLLLGTDLPPALITSAQRQNVPIILGEARFSEGDTAWSLRGAMRREVLRDMRAILTTDVASHGIALRMGANPANLIMTGPVAEIREPLSHVEEERTLIARMMNGRHAWFAASVPENEEQAVLEAHHAAMRQSHRSLLFLAPRDPARIDALAQEIEDTGLIVANRTLDEDPTDEVQVMITDGPTEMGLWYRLAPVTYLGGTLFGDNAGTHHPFEPAALGSAIVHGPATIDDQAEWLQLRGANASRQVADATELATTIAELTQPEQIASLASNAWIVSTGGAEVVNHICAPVLKALQESKA